MFVSKCRESKEIAVRKRHAQVKYRYPFATPPTPPILLAGIEKDSCSCGVCLCWGLARLYQYNLLLLSQHVLIWVNLHPVTTHLAHKHRHARTHTRRMYFYRWWRRVWRPLHPPCWPHTPGCGSGRAPWSSRSGGSPPPSGRRWTPSAWKPRPRPTGWRWAGGSTCGGVCMVTFSSLRSTAGSWMWVSVIRWAVTGLTGFILILCHLSLEIFSGK